MSGLLLSEETVQTALQLVTTLALDTISGAVGAGVTLVDAEDRKVSAASTSELVSQADDLQYQLGEGPCLLAFARGEVVRVDDLERETRWPRWRAAALPLGLRSSLSAPMVSNAQTLGAIKVYGEHPNSFDEPRVTLLTRFADQAAILLANVASFANAERLSQSLQEALRARNVIALANGMLMERHHLRADQAFLLLVEQAKENNRELAVEAATVIESTFRGHG
jgi:GAF domain-containing protein